MNIITLGGVYVDIIGKQFPLPDFSRISKLNLELVGDGYRVEPGGSAVNFARTCRTLGASSICVGKTGNDVFADLLVKYLHEEGVVPHFLRDKNVQTNVSCNLSGDEHTLMIVLGNANQSLTCDEAEDQIKQVIKKDSILYLGGVLKMKKLYPRYESIIGAAKLKGAMVVLDHGRIHSGVIESDIEFIRKLVSHVDVYLPSKEEFLEVWKVASIEDGLKSLAEMYPQLITVVKDGISGSVSLIGGHTYKQPIIPVTVISTIGAGDSYNAGFLTSFSEHHDVPLAMKFATAAAAYRISRNDLPNRKDVSAML